MEEIGKKKRYQEVYFKYKKLSVFLIFLGTGFNQVEILLMLHLWQS